MQTQRIAFQWLYQLISYRYKTMSRIESVLNENVSITDLEISEKKKKKEKREEKESVAFVPRGMIQRRVYIVFARGRSVADVYLATDATKANNENMCWMQEASLANLFLSARPIVRDLTLSVAIRRCLVALTRDSLLLHIAAGY